MSEPLNTGFSFHFFFCGREFAVVRLCQLLPFLTRMKPGYYGFNRGVLRCRAAGRRSTGVIPANRKTRVLEKVPSKLDIDRLPSLNCCCCWCVLESPLGLRAPSTANTLSGGSEGFLQRVRHERFEINGRYAAKFLHVIGPIECREASNRAGMTSVSLLLVHASDILVDRF